jgi:hypothetical protein
LGELALLSSSVNRALRSTWYVLLDGAALYVASLYAMPHAKSQQSNAKR